MYMCACKNEYFCVIKVNCLKVFVYKITAFLKMKTNDIAVCYSSGIYSYDIILIMK